MTEALEQCPFRKTGSPPPRGRLFAGHALTHGQSARDGDTREISSDLAKPHRSHSKKCVSTRVSFSLGSMRHRRIVAKHEGHVRNSIRNAAEVYGLRGTSEDDTGILSPFRFNGVATDPVSSDQL